MMTRKQKFTASGSIILMSGGGVEGFYCVRAALLSFGRAPGKEIFGQKGSLPGLRTA